MNLKTLAAATCLALATASSSFAAIVDFDYSITNGTETVTGTIFGLDDSGNGTSPAMSVTADFPTYSEFVFDIPSANFNDFTVTNGEITFADFVSFSATVNGTYGYLNIYNGLGTFVIGMTEIIVQQPIVFTQHGVVPNDPPVSAVPLPAGGLLLLSGLAGIAGLKRRKKRDV